MPSKASSPSTMLALKVVCLNMWHGGSHFDHEPIEFLKSENADIVLLQEVNAATDASYKPGYRTMQVLRERLGYEYDDFALAFLDIQPDARVEQGNAVFSKFPISSRDVVFLNEPYGEREARRPELFPSTPRNVQHLALDTPAGEVNVFNFQGVWDLDGDNYSDRRKTMSKVLLAMVRDKPNVILAGDTNAKATNPAMVALESELKSVFGTSLTTTFNMQHKTNPGYATAPVDLMFVSPDIEIAKAECLDINVSDHLPLVATLNLIY
jgi:endonuclease/exonuclease/phosphatase family metal-dependent hydrolase